VLVENNKSRENELKDSKELSHRPSRDHLKNLVCVQKYVSNKPSMIFDNLGASTSHAANYERKILFVKPVKVEVNANIVCLDKGKNSCMNNYVKPKFKAHLRKQTQAKFVLTCHHCGIIGHIRPNCC
jgi:ribonuclease HII